MRICAYDHHAANNDERNPFGRPHHARGVREPARTAGTEPRHPHTGRRWSNAYRTPPGGDERQGSITKSRARAARVKGRQRRNRAQRVDPVVLGRLWSWYISCRHWLGALGMGPGRTTWRVRFRWTRPHARRTSKPTRI